MTEKPKHGIVVDGSCNGNPGPGEYRGIDIETKKILFSQKFSYTTNNVMEFCALVHAIKYKKERGLDLKIYSDSFTAISWVNKKSIKSDLVRDARTVIMWKFITNCIGYLINNFTEPHFIEKWDTENWGENPADFGKKQNNFIPAKKIKSYAEKNPNASMAEFLKYFNL